MANIQKRRLAGFTLIELLVSMIIASIITVGLLGLVVQLTETNQRDVARTEVQQDMQAAIDYIAQDLRESVYVYDNACLTGQGTTTLPVSAADCPGLKNYIPASLKDNVMLAFWRTNLLPQAQVNQCKAYGQTLAANPGSDAAAIAARQAAAETVKDIPCIAQNGYTLVVYSIDRSGPTAVWKGPARLKRYQLTQFNDSGSAVKGYVDPLNSAALGDLRFQHWPFQKASDIAVPRNQQAALPDDTSAVLVDFVDGGEITAADFVCPSPSQPTYNTAVIPAGFRACVRGRTFYNPNSAAVTANPTLKARLDAEVDAKQEIVLYLAGNVTGKPGFPGASSTARLAPIQTRVLSRSILR
jgi:prepilin-type N-terminal cleavage/methylation domain-containing protein